MEWCVHADIAAVTYLHAAEGGLGENVVSSRTSREAVIIMRLLLELKVPSSISFTLLATSLAAIVACLVFSVVG